MAGVTEAVSNKRRIWENLLNKIGHSSEGSVVKRITVQTGVTDGGADLVLTYALLGDIIYDVDNDDYYLTSVKATTVIKLNV
jgi:hypothetical protein